MIQDKLNNIENRIRLLELETIILSSLEEIFEMFEKNIEYQTQINNIINRVYLFLNYKKKG